MLFDSSDFGLFSLFLFLNPVKIMNPVGAEEIDQENDAAECPGDGVGPGDRCQLVEEFQGYGDIGHPEQAPAAQHGKHGHGGFACAPHNTGDAVGKGQQAVEQADGLHVPGAEPDGFLRIGEKADQLRRKQVGQHTDDLGHRAAAGDAEAYALFDPVVTACAKILSHEGGQGLRKAGHGQEGKALQLGIGAAAGHSGLAEAVDIGLDHHVGKGDDAVLHAGGQTVADNIQKAFAVETEIPEPDTVGGIHPQQMDQAQKGADTLGDGGGNGGRAYTEAKSRHKQQVQADIDKRGYDQIEQGVFAVAYGVENAHENVIHDRKQTAAEVKTEIFDGLGQHFRRCAHPAQDHRRQADTHNGQHRTGHKAEGNGCVDGLAHGVILLGTESTGNDHTGTHSQAVEKADHHEDQTAGGADGGQGIVTDEITHTPGIEGVIKLLEHIPKKDRQGKQQDRFPNRPLGQGLALTLQSRTLLSQKMGLLYRYGCGRSSHPVYFESPVPKNGAGHISCFAKQAGGRRGRRAGGCR